MLCVGVDAGGMLYVLDPQPTVVGECSMVVTSGAAVVNTPLALTANEGAQIGFAIALIWALAYGFRLMARAGEINDNGSQ